MTGIIDNRDQRFCEYDTDALRPVQASSRRGDATAGRAFERTPASFDPPVAFEAVGAAERRS
jgi:hypothetical protein